jgi:cytochrome c
MRISTILTGALLIIGLATPAFAQSADLEAGKKVFNKCRACHAIGPGATNKVGPELNGVVAEPVASTEGYNFSPALKKFAEANPAWTDALLTEWLADPKKLVPGTKMAFPGLKKPEEIAAVITYLKSFDKTGAAAAPAN